MWDFNLSAIIGLMRKTYPFLVFRFLVYAAITGIALAITGGGAGVGWIGGAILGDASKGGAYGGMAGAAGAYGFLYYIREYVLYQVKAGHIALLVKFLHNEPVPEGKGMVEYASAQVKEHFKESSVLFAVDQLIKGVLKAISRLFNTVATAIPIPGLAVVISIISKIVSMSLSYVDEIILAYYMKNGAKNIWADSAEGLVFYTQNYRKMLKNAFWVSLLVWGLTFVVFLLVLGPFAIVTTLIPALAGPVTFAIAALFAWGIKSAVIDPIAMTALMQVYFKAIEGQSPRADLEQKLEQVSDKFKTLKEKGMELAGMAPNPFGRSDHTAS